MRVYGNSSSFRRWRLRDSHLKLIPLMASDVAYE